MGNARPTSSYQKVFIKQHKMSSSDISLEGPCQGIPGPENQGFGKSRTQRSVNFWFELFALY